VDAQVKRDRSSAIEALVTQVSSPVQWEAVVTRLASEGVTTYVEVGPGTVLSGLVKKIQAGRPGGENATVLNFGSPDDLEAVERAIGPGRGVPRAWRQSPGEASTKPSS
jgi:malonyl CoA-acyl carrier protein transacylase